jgi:hypothetical protein
MLYRDPSTESGLDAGIPQGIGSPIHLARQEHQSAPGIRSYALTDQRSPATDSGTGKRAPATGSRCTTQHGRLMVDFSPDSVHLGKLRHSFWLPGLMHLGLD